MKPRVLRLFKEYLVISFGAILAAAAIYFFMLPSRVAVGSGSALAMVLSNFIPLPVSLISLTINVILLVLGFLLVGREFGAKTVYTSIVIPLALGAFELLFPNFSSLTEEPMLDILCYMLIVGIAMAILFSSNASSGGLDIVAKILNKYFRIGIGSAMSFSGMLVALSSAFCYDKKTVVLSVLATYLSGLVLDRFIFGLNIKRRVCVISEKNKEIIDFLLHELNSGATLYEGIGAYDQRVRQEIITIVDKNEYRRLMDYIKRVDDAAFVTVYSVNEVRYRPKPKKSRQEKKQ